ncbi:Permease of the drug/metabolite transporter (DMT) superfamily [Tenacibaculum sp. MAR_2009_124]|uniref:DMT family transporter n=1 Tax=Tenacibaculum sp. MAR_2009_124 TaxID=1250059 RepID=UPI0008971F96|nr:DMT family transporter [Tenacibaculum sp. MAR_2009_124]SEC26940.1 Permease of the drug/metabolite transporter (DMT) superfamily [Tenacibaculum sp. MAR_2009_124]
MNGKQQKWGYLIVLSLIWGSSFILMKKALIGLTPIQLGALRVIITGIFLLIIGYRSIKRIRRAQWKWVLLSSLLGTFFPAFLYAYAVKGIDSSIASILNSITPFNALWIGATFFSFNFKKSQLLGIFIGLLGTVTLILQGANMNPDQNYWYALLPIISSFGYAFNVNIIKKYLQDIDALAITTGNFVLIIIPALLVLAYTGFFSSFELTSETKPALVYIFVLAIVGTGFAKILFNKLIQISSPIFSTSVTYLIPIVAVMWGVVDGEELSFLQLLAGIVILFGVYLVNKKK